MEVGPSPTSTPTISFLDSAVQTVQVSTCKKEVQTSTMLKDSMCQTDFIFDTTILDNLQNQIELLNQDIERKEIMINTLNNEMNCFYVIHNEQNQINCIKEVFCKKSNSLKFKNFDSNVSMLSDISLDEMYKNQAPIVRTLFDCLIQCSQEDKSIENH